MVIEETLRRATDRLVAQFRPQRVILFGSQARGTADARSDVDLLVICAVPPGPGSRRELMVAMDRALRGMELATDVIILTPEEFEHDATSQAPWRVRLGAREECSMKLPDSPIIEKVRQWLAHADEDLRAARHGFSMPETPPCRVIAFHAQQCAENAVPRRQDCPDRSRVGHFILRRTDRGEETAQGRVTSEVASR